MSTSSSSPLRILEESKKRRAYSDWIGISVIAMAIGQILTLGVVALLFGATERAANRGTPPFVQLADGSTAKILPLTGNDRPSDTIAQFAANTLTRLYSWSSNLPAKKPEEVVNPLPDKGVDISSSQGAVKVTTPLWQTSFAVDAGFREQLLGQLGQRIIEAKVFSAKNQTVYLPTSTSPPEKMAEGIWKVRIVGSLVVLSPSGSQQSVFPLNKELYIKAVPVPIVVDRSPPGASLTPQEIAARERSAGLAIYSMRDLLPNGDIVPAQPTAPQPTTP
jgi:hypothetical protein